MEDSAEEYLNDLLQERYRDGVDRREQRVFDGDDIKEAFIEGAKSAALTLAEITSLFDEDEDEDEDDGFNIINNN